MIERRNVSNLLIHTNNQERIMRERDNWYHKLSDYLVLIKENSRITSDKEVDD